MRAWTLTALLAGAIAASPALAGPTFHAHRCATPWIATIPYTLPYPYPFASGWQPPVAYGVPSYPIPAWYGYDPDYLYRLQPGFRFHEPEGRRGFSIRGYTLPGGR